MNEPGASDSSGPPGAGSEAQLARIARGGALNLFGAVISAVSGFVLVLIVANGFSEEDAGLLFATVSAFLIAVAVATLGTDTGLARYLLPLTSRGGHREARAAVRSAVRPVLVLGTLMAGAVLVFAPVLGPLIGLSGERGTSFLRIFAVVLPFAVAGDFWLGCTRAFGRMRPTVVVDSVMRTILQLVLVGLAVWVGMGPVALAVGWATPYVLLGVVATPLGLNMARQRTARPAPDSDGPDRCGPDRDSFEVADFWRYTGPRGLARVSQIALQRIDIVLVAALVSAPAAAVYTAATRFVVLGQFAAQAIQRVLQPQFSQLMADDAMDVVRHVFKTSTAWSMALSWPLYAIAAGAAPLYLSLFGEGYTDDAVPVVVIMAMAMMLAIASGPLDTLLLMAGRSSTSLAITLGALALDVVASVLLLPIWGIVGAAVAWAAAVLFRNLATFAAVRGITGVSPLSGGTVVVGVGSIAVFAVPLGLLSIFGALGPWAFTICVLTGSLGYAGLLYLTRRSLELASLRALLPARLRSGS